MNRVKLSPGLITIIILALFVMAALFIRIFFPHSIIFDSGWIKFAEVDACYHMRVVDNLVTHFPQRLTFDPYMLYPEGHILFWPPFFDWLLAGIIWIAGLGSPSQHLIDVVGVYFPTVIGALTIVPVYFIGKEVFNRWVGLISAGLIIFIPGFVSVSTLGYTDHHVAETLFSTTVILFMILAIKSARGINLNPGNFKLGCRATIGKPLTYSLLAGIFLGIYLLTAPVGLILIFLIFIFFIYQFIIDHLRNRHTDYLLFIATVSIAVGAIISLPLLPHMSWLYPLYLPSLLITFATPFVMAGISRLLRIRRVRPIYYPITVMTLGLAGLGIFYLVAPSLLTEILEKFGEFIPHQLHSGMTIAEIRPLLAPLGTFSLSFAWSYFTTGFFISLIALGLLTYEIIKLNDTAKGLLVVWSLVMLAATLGQNRFSHYYAVNVALLSGYFSWYIINLTSSIRVKTKAVRPIKKKKKQVPTAKPIMTKRTMVVIVLGIAVFSLVFIPNIWEAVSTAKEPRNAPSNYWYEALYWFRDNSPEPFGDPDAYYQLYQPPETGEYRYPDSAYGVISWVDYGHWITRFAHRIPVASPFQEGIKDVSRVLAAQDEVSADSNMDALNSRYIIIDSRTLNYLPAMSAVVTGNTDELYELYYRDIGGNLLPIQLFYPEFYKSLAARLFLFDGSEVTEWYPQVVSYVEKTNSKGDIYKEITELNSFSSDEEAEAYIASQQSGSHRIVSTDAFVSPVPVQALEDYKLIYQSSAQVTEVHIADFVERGTPVSALKIFEYAK